ncbi:RNA polymerase sigma factor [Xanthobacteraceae bacterium A53D]
MTDADIRHGMYLSHRAALIDYATPILGSRDAAEDIVQDAYLRFMPARLRATSPEQALGFLYRTVRNLAFDVLKRRKVETRDAAQDGPFWLEPQAAPTPEQQLLLCDQVRIVSEVLAGLPLEARVAVEMHRFGGFTLDEVASHLGISITTAHRHVRSAMLKIATRLDPDPG